MVLIHSNGSADVFVHCSFTSLSMPGSPLSRTLSTGEPQLLRRRGVLLWLPQASYHLVSCGSSLNDSFIFGSYLILTLFFCTSFLLYILLLYAMYAVLLMYKTVQLMICACRAALGRLAAVTQPKPASWQQCQAPAMFCGLARAVRSSCKSITTVRHL